MAPQTATAAWLSQHGPSALEKLFHAVVLHPPVPILLADDQRHYRDVSAGVSRILGLPRAKIIGQTLDDFAAPDFKAVIDERWRSFLEKGEQEGTLELLGPDGAPRRVEYVAKVNVLPVRHVLVLRDNSVSPLGGRSVAAGASPVQDYALFLLDPAGRVANWYGGAERIYGYPEAEILGRDWSILHVPESQPNEAEENLKRADGGGHWCTEGWQNTKRGERFWANTVTLALKDERGALQGFAAVVRDFSGRHERDERTRRDRVGTRVVPLKATVAGVLAGELDQVPEINDAPARLSGLHPRRSRQRPFAMGRSHAPRIRGDG
jgi:PAS domain S-box-containing protein